ncbi:LysR family transcriptional regulator [Pseudomonas brassicacearum]|uniref:LysR family transcriptional regulator n=1 Tax=Pseudomonas brassicacearum TaxID=930166 RepID=UPI001D9759BF|nr:LysR family transcriptional regulator [Pseudomonas brassicacearum]CAH0156818.1 Nodulation protein D 2 [Pseudomonas brassicacearum]
MRLNKLDLNQLIVLDVILTEQNISRAAEKIFLSQSATSCALGRLRQYFDDELIVRVGKRMVLTELGKSLKDPVSDIIFRIKEITTTRVEFDPKKCERKFVIEASDYVMNVLMGSVIQEIYRLAPSIHFDLRPLSHLSPARLENAEVDLLIAPDFFIPAGHPSQLLFHDTWSCITWDQNDMVRERLTLGEYLAAGHVVTQWGGGQLSMDEIVASNHGYKRVHEVSTSSFSLFPTLLIGTSRVATLQTKLASLLRTSHPLNVFPCPLPMPLLNECIQCHEYQREDNAIKWLIDVIKQAAAKL